MAEALVENAVMGGKRRSARRVKRGGFEQQMAEALVENAVMGGKRRSRVRRSKSPVKRRRVSRRTYGGYEDSPMSAAMEMVKPTPAAPAASAAAKVKFNQAKHDEKFQVEEPFANFSLFGGMKRKLKRKRAKPATTGGSLLRIRKLLNVEKKSNMKAVKAMKVAAKAAKAATTAHATLLKLKKKMR